MDKWGDQGMLVAAAVAGPQIDDSASGEASHVTVDLVSDFGRVGNDADVAGRAAAAGRDASEMVRPSLGQPLLGIQRARLVRGALTAPLDTFRFGSAVRRSIALVDEVMLVTVPSLSTEISTVPVPGVTTGSRLLS